MRISDWSSDVCSSDLIARTIMRQHRHREIKRAEHPLLPLANRQSADGIAIETDVDQPVGRDPAQVLEHRSLLDAEQRGPFGMRAAFIKALARPPRPAHRSLHR